MLASLAISAVAVSSHLSHLKANPADRRVIGHGPLSSTYGLSVDNVLEARIVTPDGVLRTANPCVNPDLFWALLGAGQNFGVTTEFVLKAYPQDPVQAGMLIFPPAPETIEKLVAAFNDLYTVRDSPTGPKTNAAGRCGSLLAMAKPPPAGGATLILAVFAFTCSNAEADEILAPFKALGPLDNTIATHPYPKVNTLVPAIIGMRSSMKGAAFTLPLRPEFVTGVISKYDEFLAGMPDAAPSLVAFELYDPTKVTELSAGCFANRGWHLNGLVMPTWGSEGNDQACRHWARDASNMFKVELESRGEETGKGVDGGVGRRGHKGAVMLYGNYDVSPWGAMRAM